MHTVQVEGGVISSNYQDVVESFDEMNLREELLVSTFKDFPKSCLLFCCVAVYLLKQTLLQIR